MMSGREFNRQEENTIRAAVSGGLNTSSSDLLTPLEDSPDLLNVQVDFDGMVRKRNGYKTVYRRNSASASYFKNMTFVPLQTFSGKPFIIRKEGTSLVFDIKDNNGWQVAHKTHANVWNSGAAQSKMTTLIQYEPLYNRVIFVTKNHAPIQASYASYQYSFVKGGTSNTWAGIELPLSFLAAQSVTPLVMLVNGVLETVVTVTSNTLVNNVAQLAITTTNVYAAGTYTLEFVLFTWNWWAESFQIKGGQFLQPVVQGTSTITVAIPSAVLQGITYWGNGRPTMQMFSNLQYDNVYTIANPPAAVNQYWFSDGSTSPGFNLQSSPFYATFGATPTTTRSIYVHRGYLLPFFGGGGANLQATAVSVTPLTRATNCQRYSVSPPSEGGAGTGVNVAGTVGFYLRNRATYLASSTVANQRSPVYITLDATANAQGGQSLVGLEEVFQITDINTADLITAGCLGSGVASETIPAFCKAFSPEFPPAPINARAYPVAGLSWFSDYKRNSHPAAIGTLQGRIVIGGFPLQPMTLCASNVYDSILPGVYSNNFDVVYTLPDPSQPFDLTMPGASNDSIVALLEFNDSLFVFSKQKVFRVHNNGQYVDATNVSYSVVADIGIPNSSCVVVTDKYPVFLAASGVYALVPTDTEAGYEVVELSNKIRNYIQEHNVTLNDVGLVLYDGDRKELYVGVSDNSSTDRCGEMLVYNIRLESWYKYTTKGGASFHASTGALVHSGDTILPGVWFCVPGSFNDDDNVAFIEMNQPDIPFDMEQFFDWSPGLPFTTSLPIARYSTTSVTGVHEYDPSVVSVSGEKAVRLSPIRDLEDVFVSVNGVTQVFGTDYTKTDRGTIRFTNAPGGGVTIIIESRANINGTLYHPIAMYNATTKFLYRPQDITVDISGNFYRLTALSPTPTAGDDMYIGYCFPAWYTTPTFNRGNLNVKRIKEYIGYYQNNVSDIWRDSETYPSGGEVGRRKVNIDVDMSFVFSNEYEGLLQTELFSGTGYYPSQTTKDYTRVSVPIIGGGYNFQVIHHHKGVKTFKLAGYEIKAVAKPGKGYSKSEEEF